MEGEKGMGGELSFRERGCGKAGEDFHLADGDLVKAFEAFGLGKSHVDEFGVHAFDVGKDEKLLDAGVFTHVALQGGICVAPLAGGQAKERHIQQVGLGGIGHSRLRRSNFRRDEVCFDGIRVDAVVQLREGAVEVPSERETSVFVILEALEFLDEVYLELGTDPHAEFKRDVFMGIGASVAACGGLQADGSCLFDPIFDADLVAVEAGLAFNCGEFAIIKRGVVDRFPNSQKLDGISVPQPIGDEKVAVLRSQHVGEGDEVFSLEAKDCNFLSLNLDRGFFRLGHR